MQKIRRPISWEQKSHLADIILCLMLKQLGSQGLFGFSEVVQSWIDINILAENGAGVKK